MNVMAASMWPFLSSVTVASIAFGIAVVRVVLGVIASVMIPHRRGQITNLNRSSHICLTFNVLLLHQRAAADVRRAVADDRYAVADQRAVADVLRADAEDRRAVAAFSATSTFLLSVSTCVERLGAKPAL